MDIEELLRIVCAPTRRKGLDKTFGYEVTTVSGYLGESLIVNLKDYEQIDKELTIYRLRDEFPKDKYR